MKKLNSLFTVILLSTATISFSQVEFTYNQEGLTPEFVVVELDSLSQEKVFQSSINWIKETYKNPDEVIKTTINNEKVRFEGYKENLFCIETLGMNTCYSGTYTIEVEFKDNKYKFSPLSIEYRVPASQYTAGGKYSINFKDGSGYYNRKGIIKSSQKNIPPSIENLFNDLNKSLKNYLEQSTTESEGSDDW